ncbi:MAG: abortive infection family protein [Candidatus Riflebacteria bacterium]|nr:abortive infection family protein [Candidatus Riflebacteria bacterium]
MKTIIKILKQRGYSRQAELLQNSIYQVIASSSYGSAWHSLISTAEIFSPVDAYVKLLALSCSDQEPILEAFKAVFPPRDNSEEVRFISFFPDGDLPETQSKIDTTKLSELKIDFVEENIKKCKDKITQNDFSGAITNARTLVETICIFIIESKEEEPEGNGDLPKLFRHASKLLNMDASQHVENSLKQIIQGCNSIISGLSSLRNSISDAHGRSTVKVYKPAKRHADLVVNVALAISEFLVESYNKNGT